MASIFERQNKNGSVSYRVMFRRKGLSTFCTCFNTHAEAVEFAKEFEPAYTFDHDNFIKNMKTDQLYEKRKREFQHKDTIPPSIA